MSVDIMRVINSKMSFIVIYHKQKKTDLFNPFPNEGDW